MSDTVRTIKERLNIVDVIGGYVDLKQAGVSYKGRCPFHKEKTPSFFVSPERGTFHCFGCGRGGDIFTFVEEQEGLDFKGALTFLAHRAGVELVPEAPEKRELRDRMYEAMEEATVFFQRALVEHEEARTYLYKRGVKPETLKSFRIGFAPDSWDAILTHLSSLGYTREEIEAIGLIKKSEKPESRSSHYDRFRSRIMFPITDTAGRVIGFSGRIFGNNDAEAAKYINSPETDIYKKSHVLFGFDKARSGIREKKRVVIVEGQMDLLLCHQAGYTETVALSGTALTLEQVEMMHRLTKEMIFAFDGDSAGIAAAERSARIALSAGMDVRMVELPEGKDPADVVGESTETWEKILSQAQHIIDFFTVRWKKEGSDMRQSALLVSEHVVSLVALVENEIEQDHFIQTIASALSASPDAVRAEIEKYESAPRDYGYTPLEEHKIHSGENHTTKRTLHEEYMVGILEWQKSAEVREIIPEEAFKRMNEVLEGESVSFDSYDETTRTRLAFEAEERCVQGDTSAKDEWEEQFILWKKAVLSERKELVTKALEEARFSGADTTELMKTFQNIIRADEET
ncbi:MAG: DNA primase [Parcubacteria group bacterium]|nr:DNA primase [Parcubacteria group bacterium]